MRPLVFIFFMVSGFNSFGQSDSLLFRSLERILRNEKGIGYKDDIYLAVNKYDLERLKIKDTTIISAAGRDFNVILLKNPSDKKDFYVLPIGYHKDNYIVFNIQNCNRLPEKTFTISYTKNQDNLFELDAFELAEPLMSRPVNSE